jgi:hypothetical protein
VPGLARPLSAATVVRTLCLAFSGLAGRHQTAGLRVLVDIARKSATKAAT